MTNPIKIIKKSELKEIPNQIEVWNSISNPWKKYVVLPLAIVKEFLENKKGKIIDLGCGTGRNMTNNKLEYYGVDFSKGQLKHAKEFASEKKINASFFKLDASNLDKEIFKKEMFDGGVFISTLHCIDTEEKREKSLKELFRVLKKGASALINVWNSEDKRFDCVGNYGEIYMSWREEDIPYMRYYYLYHKKEFLALLKKVGFEIVKFYKPSEHDRFSKKNWIVEVRKN